MKPGRHEYRTRATSTLNLTADTTIHHIAVHLHPWAESISLTDLTSGQVVFESHAKNLDDSIGLSEVDSLSSPTGVPVYQNHEYELLTIYNNTTDVDQDAMAVMYAYLLDKDYHRPHVAGDPVAPGGAVAARLGVMEPSAVGVLPGNSPQAAVQTDRPAALSTPVK